MTLRDLVDCIRIAGPASDVDAHDYRSAVIDKGLDLLGVDVMCKWSDLIWRVKFKWRFLYIGGHDGSFRLFGPQSPTDLVSIGNGETKKIADFDNIV